VLQSDGKIVIGGTGSTGGFGLVRLNTNGSFDSSFGSGGVVTASASGAKRGSSSGLGLTIQRVPAITGEERIVLVGWSRAYANPSNNANSDWTLMRFRLNGAVDTTFGSSGVVKTYFSGFGDQARDVQIDSNNRIVVAGLVRRFSDGCGGYIIDSAVVRYTPDGSLDGTFGGGQQFIDVYGGSDTLYGLALQTDGKILIAEVAQSSDATVTYFAIVRFNGDGSRDTSFGTLGNGVVTTDFYGNPSWAFGGIAVQPTDGRIIVAGGATLVPPNSQSEMVVARYWP
jgi:uncharacterized delta-60 repeat protein